MKNSDSRFSRAEKLITVAFLVLELSSQDIKNGQ